MTDENRGEKWVLLRQRLCDKVLECMNEKCASCCEALMMFMKNFLLSLDDTHCCAAWFNTEIACLSINLVDSMMDGHCCQVRRRLDLSAERALFVKQKKDFWFTSLAQLIYDDILSLLSAQISGKMFSDRQKPLLLYFLLEMHGEVSRWEWLFIGPTEVLFQTRKPEEDPNCSRVAYTRSCKAAFLDAIDELITKVRQSVNLN